MLMKGFGKRSIDGAADGNHEPSFGFSQTVDMTSRFSNSLQTFCEVLGSSSSNVTAMDGLSIVFKNFREYVSKLPDNAAKDKVLELIQRSERLMKKALKKWRTEATRSGSRRRSVRRTCSYFQTNATVSNCQPTRIPNASSESGLVVGID